MGQKEQSRVRNQVESFVHEVTAELLQFKTNDMNFVRGHAKKSVLPYREYMTAILLASSEFKLLYMVHFWLEDAKFLVSKSLAKTAAEVEYWRAIDFFKEYCNVVAGKTKKAFKSQNIHLNQSLPIGIGGFNLALFDEKKPNEKRLYWSQNAGEIEIDFSARYSILDPNIIPKLANLPKYAEIHDDATAIEFF